VTIHIDILRVVMETAARPKAHVQPRGYGVFRQSFSLSATREERRQSFCRRETLCRL